MSKKIAIGCLGLALMLLTAPACIFGGDDGSGNPGAENRGAIPTATLPATLPEPIVLGQNTGAISAGGSGASTVTYTVESGDTLGAIASAQGIAPDQQAAWIAEVLSLNGLTDARQLAVGAELILPAPTTPPETAGSPAEAPAAAEPTATAAPSVSSGGTYTVEDGDYPLVIAQKLGVPEEQQTAWVNELVALNGIDPSGLSIGQVLELPASTP